MMSRDPGSAPSQSQQSTFTHVKTPAFDVNRGQRSQRLFNPEEFNKIVDGEYNIVVLDFDDTLFGLHTGSYPLSELFDTMGERNVYFESPRELYDLQGGILNDGYEKNKQGIQNQMSLDREKYDEALNNYNIAASKTSFYTPSYTDINIVPGKLADHLKTVLGMRPSGVLTQEHLKQVTTT